VLFWTGVRSSLSRRHSSTAGLRTKGFELTVKEVPGMLTKPETLTAAEFDTRKASAPQLLEALRDAVASEKLPLTFDHFSLHRNCLILLQAVKDRTASDLVNMDQMRNLQSRADVDKLTVTVRCIPGLVSLVEKTVMAKVAQCFRGFLEKGSGGIGLMILKQKFSIDVKATMPT
jgi:hypothetical protein